MQSDKGSHILLVLVHNRNGSQGDGPWSMIEEGPHNVDEGDVLWARGRDPAYGIFLDQN